MLVFKKIITRNRILQIKNVNNISILSAKSSHIRGSYKALVAPKQLCFHAFPIHLVTHNNIVQIHITYICRNTYL